MRRSRNAIQVFPRLFNLIYPRRCPICDGLTGGCDRLVCEYCAPLLQRLKEPLCKKCGKPLGKEEEEYCPDCAKGHHLYKRGRAVFLYDDSLRASVARFKYGNRREYADFYVDELVKAWGPVIRSWEADALIPIPLHRSRKRRRGFNQAELLAGGIGQSLGIPVLTGWLVRTKKTRPQKELSDLERKQNLKNAFQAVRNDVKLKTVILVDDIYTTGSTIDAAAALLLENGVENVYFLSICIGRGY